MIRTLYGNARTSGLLPAIGWLLLVVGLAAFASGLWGGYEWRKGRDAIVDAAALRQQQSDARKQLEELRGLAQKASQRDANNAAAYRDAAARIGAIASELESTNAKNRRFSLEQSQQMAALLRSRPDLSAVDIGADGLRIWNQSNQGAAGGTAPAGTGDRGRTDGAMPGAAGSKRRTPAQPAGQPSGSRGAVPRMRVGKVGAVTCNAGTAADRLGLVLRCAGSGRPGQHQLQGDA